MIENDHQLEITKNHLKNFKASVESYKELTPKNRNEELDIKAHIDSLESFIEEFEEDIAKYEKLDPKAEMIQIEFTPEELNLFVGSLKDEIECALNDGFGEDEVPLLIELKTKLEDALNDSKQS
jgi:hypothetical protein